MKNVLVINSSISGANGNSTKLVQHLLAQLPQAQVTEIDLGAKPLPHLEMAEIGAWMTPAACGRRDFWCANVQLRTTKPIKGLTGSAGPRWYYLQIHRNWLGGVTAGQTGNFCAGAWWCLRQYPG